MLEILPVGNGEMLPVGNGEMLPVGKGEHRTIKKGEKFCLRSYESNLYLCAQEELLQKFTNVMQPLARSF
jgi:hypothetical protein